MLLAGHYSCPPWVANADRSKGVLRRKDSGSSSDRLKTDVADPSRIGCFRPNDNFGMPMTLLAHALTHLLLVTAPVPPALTADRDTGQLCWAIGRLDDTVYFAGIEGREDRSESFASLIDISGLETFPARCVTLPVKDYRRLRQQLIVEWQQAELEVIDTTYMSDLDY